MKKSTRRSFLYNSLLATSAIWLPINCFSKSKQSPKVHYNKQKLGIALLGLGGYSTYQLAPALEMTEHCYLAGIITGSPHKISDWQKKYAIPDENIYSYENMQEIANNEDIDVVYVVTPPSTHAKFCIAAANAGKQIWCEKPMAMTVKECESILAACKINKVQLTIGYRVQHEPNTQTFNAYAQSKPFGEMTKVEAAAGYAGGGGSGWRFEKSMGGGALYDMGVYTVNGIRYATNMFPKRVLSAQQYTDRPHLFKEVDETTEYVLEFENGLKAVGETSVGKNINHLKVFCENGHYEMSPMQTYGGVKGSRSDGLLLNQSIPNQQAKQMDDDASAILENRPMMISGEEGLKDIRIIEAIIKAAELGSSVEI